MPLIQVQMFAGRTPQQKRDLVRALTDAFVETAGSTPDAVDVILTGLKEESYSPRKIKISNTVLLLHVGRSIPESRNLYRTHCFASPSRNDPNMTRKFVVNFRVRSIYDHDMIRKARNFLWRSNNN